MRVVPGNSCERCIRSQADILETFPPGAAHDLWLKWLAIQLSVRRRNAWTRRLGRAVEEDGDPTTHGPIEGAAKRYAALVAKFEAARKRT